MGTWRLCSQLRARRFLRFGAVEYELDLILVLGQHFGDAPAALAGRGDQQDRRLAGLHGRDAAGIAEIEAVGRGLAHPPLVHHHLEAHQRAGAREQRQIVHRLGEEIVGTAFQRLDPVGDLGKRRHHDHRNVRGVRIGLDPAADVEAIHLRHHDVEQDDVGRRRGDLGERDGAAFRFGDLEILGFEFGA